MDCDRYWSTDDAAGSAPLQYWADVVAEGIINCRIDSEKRDEFRATLRNKPLGSAMLHFVHSSPSVIQRSKENVSRHKSDHYYLIQQRRSCAELEQNGRAAVVQPGDCVLISGRSTYRIRNQEDMVGMAVAIPSAQLLGWLPEPDAVTATTLPASAGWGRALAATLANFDEKLGELVLSPSVMLDQILAHLAIAAAPEVSPATMHQRTLLRRLGDTLSDRYCEPDFDPARLAHEHGLSKRYIHGLFAKAGTSFGRELEKVRLAHAKRMLEDRRFDRVEIMEIALRCGFRDCSSFSRRFRGRYGAPPSRYRREINA